MEKTGPFAIAFTAVLDVVMAIAWLTHPGPAMTAALMGGGAITVVMLYAGSWLTVLHGEADRQLIGVGIATLTFHLIVATLSGMASSPVVSGFAFLFAAAGAGALCRLAWKSLPA